MNKKPQEEDKEPTRQFVNYSRTPSVIQNTSSMCKEKSRCCQASDPRFHPFLYNVYVAVVLAKGDQEKGLMEQLLSAFSCQKKSNLMQVAFFGFAASLSYTLRDDPGNPSLYSYFFSSTFLFNMKMFYGH